MEIDGPADPEMVGAELGEQLARVTGWAWAAIEHETRARTRKLAGDVTGWARATDAARAALDRARVAMGDGAEDADAQRLLERAAAIRGDLFA